jgi:molecular chaperone GrpE
MNFHDDRSEGASLALHEWIGAAGDLTPLSDHLAACPRCRTRLQQALARSGMVPAVGDDPGIVWREETSRAEAESPSSGMPSGAGPIGEKLDELQGQVGNLLSAFEDKIRFDAGREAIIDRLHAELQEYKSDLALKILRPLALEVIGLQDDIGKTIAAPRPEGDPIVAALSVLRDDIDDVLYRGGFESFSADGPEFDPKRQRVVRAVPTTDPARDRVVAERLRKGFEYQGRVIRPEMVNVYVASAPTAG